MRAGAAADVNGRVELDDLDRAVLWAMRSAAVGRLDCPSLRRTFLDLYGPAADQILCALLVMVRLLGHRAAGGLRMHMPGSSAVSRDELMVLSALAALQDEGGGAQPKELLGAPIDASVGCALEYVAGLLSGRGRRLYASGCVRGAFH